MSKWDREKMLLQSGQPPVEVTKFGATHFFRLLCDCGRSSAPILRESYKSKETGGAMVMKDEICTAELVALYLFPLFHLSFPLKIIIFSPSNLDERHYTPLEALTGNLQLVPAVGAHGENLGAGPFNTWKMFQSVDRSLGELADTPRPA